MRATDQLQLGSCVLVEHIIIGLKLSGVWGSDLSDVLHISFFFSFFSFCLFFFEFSDHVHCPLPFRPSGWESTFGVHFLLVILSGGKSAPTDNIRAKKTFLKNKRAKKRKKNKTEAHYFIYIR